ncbi:hypothetical protein [Amycolatopsis sp. NPDC021455]|uniref:hypothetical protein n=1 Tax=Amycolatopsis sp. NPDC021455 TaxID=3154901 RepID=UPI0033DA36BD
MATTVNLRPLLHRKQWEMCCTLSAGQLDALGAASTQFDQLQVYVNGTSSVFLYDPRQDAVSALPASPLTSWTTWACAVVYHPGGPTGTASAGTSTTVTTTANLAQSLAGYTIRITAGTGAGQERTILRNTYGANSVVTVTSAWSVTPDNTSVYLILSGRWWCLNSSGTAGMRYYDLATNTWSGALSVTGMGATNNLLFCATPALGNAVVTSTATAATSTTLTDSTRNWSASQFVNSQVRITGGAGAGQVRTITANTATALTVAAWTTTPDATSTYVIEPNDDFLYAAGNNAVALYRYSISGNTWSTLSPAVARTTTAGSGGCLSFVGVTSDTGSGSWADETNIKNCRYIYSFAGAGSANLAIYDIAANSWNNIQTAYGRGGGTATNIQSFSPSNGWSSVIEREYIYFSQPISTGAPYTLFRFNCVTNVMEAFTSTNLGSSSINNNSGKLCIASYTDGTTTIRWLYQLTYGLPTTMFRMLII